MRYDDSNDTLCMDQIFVSKLTKEENKILRECRGLRLAISRSVNSLSNSKSQFYVKSELKNKYYFIEYKNEYNFGTCWDCASDR